VVLLAGRAVAAEVGGVEPPQTTSDSPRALNDHVFIPSQLVTGPFTVTAFGTTVMAGVADASGPRFNIAGIEIGSRDYAIGAFGWGLDLDLNILRDLSLRLAANGAVFAGLDGDSILSAGAATQLGALVGGTWGRTFGDARLALVLDVGIRPALNFLIANAVIRAIEEGVFEGDDVFFDTEQVVTSPGVSFAWAPHPALGLTTEGFYQWTRRISGQGEDLNEQALVLAAKADVDLDPLIRWPIGLLGAYRATVPVSGGRELFQQASLGVFYTRRVRLALGLEVTWARGELRPNIRPNLDADAVIAAVRMRYYW
jgi:hypothetical protein